jgi:hypothetical protein
MRYEDNDVRSTQFRKPDEILSKLVTAGVELVHVRDSALGAALDVPPLSVDPVSSPSTAIATGLYPDSRGLAWRGARKIYQSLKRVEPLQPVLQKLRDEFRRRL